MIANANISCPGPTQLRLFLNNDLSESERQAVEQHVETCAACQCELDRLTSAVADALSIPPISAGHAARPATLGTDVASPSSKADWPTMPGYTIRRELGRGARGVVYLADDARLKRPVAVKVIKHGVELRPRELSRFRTEAEAMARLRHANIIPIYDVGENKGRPFLAMEYLEGGSLGDAVGASPQPPRTAAALVETLAKAMHHAHQRGVIHRDLKPGNVLLAANTEFRGDAGAERTMSYVPDPARVKITDFGLAKLLDEDGDRTGLTLPGEPMGTPSYMSPEQANGDVHEIGTRSDVYALGAVLYKLLTGHAPYEGTSEWEVLDKVRSRTETPVQPRKRRPDIPRDLEAICLKCLEKESARRYASADVLANELRRFLDGDALRHTGRVGITERLWRWGRRNPAWGTAAALAVALLVGLAIVPTVMAIRKNEHNRELQKALRDTQYQLAVNHLDQGINLCEQGNGGFGLLKLAQGLAKTPHDADDLKYVFRTNLASWPDRLHTLTAMLDHGREIHAAAFRPDGKSVLTAGADGTAKLWDIKTGEVQRVFKHPPLVRAAAFSPDGKVLVTAGSDRMARLWNSDNGEVIGPPMEHAHEVHAVAFSPDGRAILTGGGDADFQQFGTEQLWDAATGKPFDVVPYRHKSMVNSVAFSPDGKTALSGGWDNAVHQWEVATGLQIGESIRLGSLVTSVAFSPDGSTTVTAAERRVQLWNAQTGQAIGYPLLHGSMVESVAFSPDGRFVLTGSHDKSARVWDVQTGKIIGQSLSHKGPVRAVAFSPDGRTLLTGSDDGTARLWEAASGKPRGICWQHQANVRAVAFSPDGKHAVTGGWDGIAQVWDTTKGTRSALLGHIDAAILPEVKAVLCVAFSHDGKLVLTGGADKHARLWDAATGKPGLSLPHGGWVSVAAFSPVGRIAMTGSTDGTAYIWNVDTGGWISVAHGGGVRAVAFSPNGQIALTGGNDNTARLWDVATGAHLATLPHDDEVCAVAFCADNRTVLTGSKNNVAMLWDVSMMIPLLIAKLPHQKPVTAVAFSPDGKLAVTASFDNTVCLWESANGKPFTPCPCLWHADAVHAVAFSPDGHFVVSGGADGTVRLWDVATGRQVGPPLPQQSEVHALAVSPSDDCILAGSNYGDARLWRMPVQVEGDEKSVTLRMQMLIGMRLHDSGMVEALDAQAWQRCRQKLATFGEPQ